MSARDRRDDFTEKTKAQLSKRSGLRCSNPSCGITTIGPGDAPTATMSIGVAAHICAASPGGKRYDAGMTADQRIAIENGIWLCQNCAKLIDSDVDMFPVEKLRHWRTTAEERAREALRVTKVAASVSGAGPADAGWEAVSFANQRSIRFAMAGHGLAEHDVQACPRLEEAQYVIDEVEQRRFATLAGHSGSGKSIVAYHAARHFSDRGWRVLRLSNTTAVSTAALDGMARRHDRTLLLVDNAQTLPPAALAALSAAPRDDLAVVTITTINDALPRHTIVIDPKRAVATLARAASERAGEWTQILKELDARIGEEPLDVPYERRVEDAATADAPWSFFFVARGGWQAAKRQMSSLRARDRADLLVVAVAVGQILHLDGPIPQEWLDRVLPSLGRSREWLTHAERVGIETGALLHNGLRCPHVAYADNVLRIAFDDLKDVCDTGLITFLQTVFTLNTAPLRGVSWLMRELRLTYTYRFHAKEVVTDEGWRGFRDRAFSATSSEDRRDAAYGIEAVASWRPEQHRVLEPLLDVIATWIIESDAITAAAFADIVNSLINTDRTLSEGLCRRVPPSALAARFASAPLADWYVWGHLFGRFANGADQQWKSECGRELQRLGLPDRVKSCHVNTLHDVAEVVHAVVGFDLDLALSMTRAVTPFLAKAMASSPAQAWRGAQGIVWMSLGYLPKFLRSTPPSLEQQAAAKQLVESLDLPALADGINRSSYRDWEQVAELLFFIFEVSPETTHQVVPMLSIDALDRKASGRWAKPTRSLLLMLAALSTGCSDVPIKTWLEKHTGDLGEVSSVIALLHPTWAAARLEAGVPFNPDASSSLHWRQIARAIAKVRDVSVSAADSIVDACESKLASALSRMEQIYDDELPEMLAEMSGFHQQRLQAVLARIDVSVARERWHRRGTSHGSNHRLVEQLASLIPEGHALRALADSVLSDAGMPSTGSV